MKFKILLCLNLIGSISCIFNILSTIRESKIITRILFLKLLLFILEVTSLMNSTGVVGLLDQIEFNFTTLVPSNSTTNPFPQQILIRGRCFNTNLNIVLYQVSDLVSKVKSQVWIGSGLCGDLSGASTSRTVRCLILFRKKKN